MMNNANTQNTTMAENVQNATVVGVPAQNQPNTQQTLPNNGRLLPQFRTINAESNNVASNDLIDEKNFGRAGRHSRRPGAVWNTSL